MSDNNIDIILEKFAVLENLADFGIWETDINKNVLYVSRVFLQLIKLKRTDIIRQPITQIIHPDDRSIINNAYKLISDNHEQKGFICRIVTKDVSAERLFEWQYFTLYNIDSTIRSIFGTMRDITHSQELTTFLQSVKRK